MTISVENNFTLALKMLSDWHIGTGSGIPGGTDRLICRDRHGFPYIPAKTLTGILRDSCELAAKALDNQEDFGPWQELVIDIFGSQPSVNQGRGAPVPARLFIRPAFLEQALQDYILSTAPNARSFLYDALSLTKVGIAIDPDNGIAKDDHLRFYEMAAKDLVLEAECQIDYYGLDENAASGLLAAGARLINKIGGNRRRGAGKCEVEITGSGIDMDGNIQKLATISSPQPPVQNDYSNGQAENKILGPKGSPGWRKYNIDLETILPVSIHSQTLGNVGKSLDHIPGTNFLPHFAEKLSKSGIDVADAINHDHFRILPFYPVINNKRSLPVPFCIAVKKEGGEMTDPTTVNNNLCPTENSLGQEKMFKSGYIEDWGAENILPTYLNTPLQMFTHNTVDDNSQRPGRSDQQAGGVYSYEAIAAGTKLRSTLWLSDELDKAMDDEGMGLSKTTLINMGRSSKDDYGLCHYEISPTRNNDQTDLDTEITEFTLTCLSDIILPQQGTATHDLHEYLLSLLSIELEKDITLSIRHDDQQKTNRISAIIRPKRIESWHKKWNRPRPSLMCIAAGSVVVITVSDGNLTQADLGKLTNRGIGERRTEGFGHIAINLPVTTEDISRWRAPPLRDTPPSKPPSGDKPSKTLHHVTDMAFDRYIALACKLAVNSKGKRTAIIDISSETNPGKSQIGTMRSIFQQFYLSGGEEPIVSDWIKNIKDTDSRKKVWPGNSLDKIGELTEKTDRIWSILDKHSGLDTEIQNELRLAGTPDNPDIEKKKWALAVTSLFNEWVLAHNRYFTQGGK